MKVYIAGKITGESPIACGLKFGHAASALKIEGHTVLNPYLTFKPLAFNFTHEDIMHICFAAIDVCDAVYMLRDWPESKGAKMEHEYALNSGKQLIYQPPANVKA